VLVLETLCGIAMGAAQLARQQVKAAAQLLIAPHPLD